MAEIGSIILWTFNPKIPLGQARVTLAVDYTIAIASAAIFAVLNSAALIWIHRRNRIGPMFLIVISILNRVISYFYSIGRAHVLFIIWTIILVIFASLDYRKLP